MTTISYSQIEGIIESHLIKYKGCVFETVEDMQRFPSTVTLKDDPLSLEEFYDIHQRLTRALGVS
ncbi:MAG: hypothetical protein NT038_07965 [Euryarchaeota archaeon]|nr:hypothetical protein [Euryarchaeota archaeon]